MTVGAVKRASPGGDGNAHPSPHVDVPTVTTRPRFPVDDEEESDGAQVDEEPLARHRGYAWPGER